MNNENAQPVVTAQRDGSAFFCFRESLIAWLTWCVRQRKAMWWTRQNLDRPVKSSDGSVWHFRVWHGSEEGGYRQRLFFWDDQKKNCGCAEFTADQTLHIAKIKQRMQKIVTDSAYRTQYLRDLKFPVEKHY